jgi:hypothetical protein
MSASPNGRNGSEASAAVAVAPSPDDLVELWNNVAHPNLPRVKVMTAMREKHAKARLFEYPKKSFWVVLIERINRSPLLTGQRPGAGHEKWVASFDWVLNPNNLAKVLEGNYDTRK